MMDRDATLALRPAAAGALSDNVLEEINRAWTIIRAFSNTAHDVNNALQVISGSGELLASRDLEPPVRRRVEAIQEEATKAAATIERLLAYARAQGRPPQTSDVWSVVETAVNLRAASLGRSRIQLSIERDAQTPSRAMVDPSRTLQAMLNVLFVAEDRVRQRPSARIVLTVERSDRMVSVHVTATADETEHRRRDDQWPASSDFLVDGQTWAAAHIAEAQGGQLVIEEMERGQRITLTMPAAI